MGIKLFDWGEQPQQFKHWTFLMAVIVSRALGTFFI